MYGVGGFVGEGEGEGAGFAATRCATPEEMAAIASNATTTNKRQRNFMSGSMAFIKNGTAKRTIRPCLRMLTKGAIGKAPQSTMEYLSRIAEFCLHDLH